MNAEILAAEINPHHLTLANNDNSGQATAHLHSALRRPPITKPGQDQRKQRVT
jgi:hypothetical protein